jgi:hypothetical protein
MVSFIYLHRAPFIIRFVPIAQSSAVALAIVDDHEYAIVDAAKYAQYTFASPTRFPNECAHWMEEA